MKRKQTIFALLLALALLLSMVGCGASTKNAAPASGADTAASEPVWEDARTEEAAVPDEVTDAEWGETPALAEPGDPAPEPADQQQPPGAAAGGGPGTGKEREPAEKSRKQPEGQRGHRQGRRRRG